MNLKRLEETIALIVRTFRRMKLYKKYELCSILEDRPICFDDDANKDRKNILKMVNYLKRVEYIPLFLVVRPQGTSCSLVRIDVMVEGDGYSLGAYCSDYVYYNKRYANDMQRFIKELVEANILDVYCDPKQSKDTLALIPANLYSRIR